VSDVADGWGWAPPLWRTDLSDVLVVANDGHGLAAEDLALLCYFCRYKLMPLFEDSSGNGLVTVEGRGPRVYDAGEHGKYESGGKFFSRVGGSSKMRKTTWAIFCTAVVGA
jgi:hypothetical protein